MKGILHKSDISWIAKQTVIGNAYFMIGSLALMYCLGHVMRDLVYLSLCSLIGFVFGIIIIYSRVFKTIGEPVGLLYLLLAFIEASAVFVLGLYLYLGQR